MAKRQANLRRVESVHVVFTPPAPAAQIAFQNEKAVYALLFRTAAETARRSPLIPSASARMMISPFPYWRLASICLGTVAPRRRR